MKPLEAWFSNRWAAPAFALFGTLPACVKPTPDTHGSPGQGSVTASTAAATLAATPGAVIVRRVAGPDTGGVVSHCGATERLVGGGCEGSVTLTGYPVGFGATDSQGAGWRCSTVGRVGHRSTTEAFAPCQGN